MSFPPDFYLIGAQKSGTTTLAYLLSQHPNVCVAKSKEPHFFTTNWCKGLSWYQDEFSNYENVVCIDASTTYSMAPLSVENSRSAKKCLHGVPQRIYSINPNAKFIYLLRDPVDRVYSAYWYYIAKGREQQRISKAIRDDYFYLDVSNYYGQLALWLEYFPIESFLFILFEDMKQNYEQVVKDCFKFMELDYKHDIHLEKARNKSRQVNIIGRQFNRVFYTLDRSGFGYVAPSYVRGFIHRITTDYNRVFPKMQEKDRKFLCEYFAEKKHKLALLTKLSLSEWQA